MSQEKRGKTEAANFDSARSRQEKLELRIFW